MIYIVIGLVILVAGLILFAKLRNSKSLEKLTYNLTHEEAHEFKDTDELITESVQAEEALSERAINNEKVVKTVLSENERIKKHKSSSIPPISIEEVKAQEEKGDEELKD